MAQLLIGRVSPATSIQDAGRPGFQRFGLAPSGALDIVSLAVANAVAGRHPSAAAIEVGPLLTQIHVIDGSVGIAVCGASRPLRIGGRPFAPGQLEIARAGDAIDLGPAVGGVFSYVAVSGGVVGRPVLGSMSVHARAGLGSPFSRPLTSGDILECGARLSERRVSLIDAPARTPGSIRVVLGPQDDYFASETLDVFFRSTWRISPVSDRMGYRLIGPQLRHRKSANFISDGTVNGSIQVPGNGQPLVLQPERGTTGGYPKLGVIITADQGRFAQIPLGGGVEFEAIGVREAQDLAISQAEMIESFRSRLRLIRDSSQGFTLDNIADAAVNAIDFDQAIV